MQGGPDSTPGAGRAFDVHTSGKAKGWMERNTTTGKDSSSQEVSSGSYSDFTATIARSLTFHLTSTALSVWLPTISAGIDRGGGFSFPSVIVGAAAPVWS